MEPAFRIQSIHSGMLPRLAHDVRVHECEPPRLHLFGVSEDHRLLTPIDDRSYRREIDLRGLVYYDHVEQPRLTRKEPCRVLRRQDPHWKKLQKHRRALRVRLEPVKEREVPGRSVISLEDLSKLTEALAFLPSSQSHGEFAADLQCLE